MFFQPVLTRTWIFFLGLVLLGAFLHFDLIKTDPLLAYDDTMIVSPLKEINSFKGYSEHLIDLQPVRDLSFWLDFKIENALGFSVHHLSNFLIWFCIAILFYRLLVFVEIPWSFRILFVSLYFFHPAFMNAVCWVSARKHLLATGFILLATLFFLQALKRFRPAFFLVPLFYLLSVFSQPIVILWPCWAFLYFYFNKTNPFDRKWKIFFSLVFFLFVSVLLLNSFYYQQLYVKEFGHLKFLEVEGNLFSYRLMIWGRSFFQVLFPFWATPTSYYPGSILNLVGLAALVLFLFSLLKLKNKNILLWGFFAFLPLLLLSVRLTNIFGSDTYLLTMGLGLYLVFALSLQRFKSVLFLGGILVLFFVTTSLKVIESWNSDFSLAQRAYSVEATPFNLKFYLKQLFLKQDYKQSYLLSERLFTWDPLGEENDLLRGKALTAYQAIPPFKKIEFLQKDLDLKPDSPWLKYYLFFHLKNEKREQEAYDVISSLSDEQFKAFKSDKQQILQQALTLCDKVRGRCTRFTALLSHD